MMHESTRYYVEVRVTEGRELQNQLNEAVGKAIREGLVNPGRGVMVTRHDQQTFSVELTHDVPHGTISECERPVLDPAARVVHESNRAFPPPGVHVYSETNLPYPNRWNESDPANLSEANLIIDHTLDGEELIALPWIGWHYSNESAGG
ncbi:hypothetical protein AB0N65_09595 [Paenarthrobacter sp. NPDC089322]|uniref:hypothetical protein n=1 Tax=Paenarthrobacter sp. NPDC089322 TaxID=3155065 RepID=UPI003447D0FB